MESVQMAFNCVGRYAGSWSYILGWALAHENEGTTKNLGWMQYMAYPLFGVCWTQCMLYLVYAILSGCYTWCMLYWEYAVLVVNSWTWHEERKLDDLTVCSAMMAELWMRNREMGDEDANAVDNTNGYETSVLHVALLSCKDFESVLLHTRSALEPALPGMVNSLTHQILLCTCFS